MNQIHVGECNGSCLCVAVARDRAKAARAWKGALARFSRQVEADARRANPETLWRALERLRRMGALPEEMDAADVAVRCMLRGREEALARRLAREVAETLASA